MKGIDSYFRVLPWLMALLLGVLVAACGGGHDADPDSHPVVVFALAVTPDGASIPTSSMQPFTAIATYSDGSTRDVTASAKWTASFTPGAIAVSTINETTGFATGVAAGVAVITARFEGKVSAVNLNVTPAVLLSVGVTPPVATVAIGGTQPFVAIAAYSDRSTRDITLFAGWASGTPGVAAVAPTSGIATGVASGTTLITASFMGKTGSGTLNVTSTSLVSIAVTPAFATVVMGGAQAMLAKASYSDGSTVDVTSVASWSSNAPLVASVEPNTGIVTGLSAGTAVVTVVIGGKASSGSVTVSAATLVSIDVTPPAATAQVGDAVAFLARGNYLDGSTVNLTTATWTSANPAVGTVAASSGIATGLAAGSTQISATSGGKTGSAILAVTATAGRAPVGLGSAGNFVALAKTGISTTGTTEIVGDIGVSPAAASFITGFGLIADATNTFATSSLVTGKVYVANDAPPTPAFMTTAIGDMQAAFTDAAGRTLPDFTELGAGNITGMTLVPGLYKWGTGVLVSAAGVTLSGAPNAVWIFQIGQDLTVANSAMVTLSGGAQAKNVFWQVSGKAILGTAVNFKGVLLSQTLISLNTDAIVMGRLLAQSAVTLDAARISGP